MYSRFRRIHLSMTSPNKTITAELIQLFERYPPSELRQHLTTVFFGYLNNVPTDIMPPDFKETSEGIHHIIRFLSQAEKHLIEK